MTTREYQYHRQTHIRRTVKRYFRTWGSNLTKTFATRVLIDDHDLYNTHPGCYRLQLCNKFNK